ncbi:haloalkane dehalogenase [Rhodobium orientis]|uniref:Haloalkane dehalogenase n=1 Tax=Rhodobium orientis TaxID=34017 RepID=A0A327JWD0_9HYPH|nr:haloalkane dehalogenase [Rhodobium orientis]MBB4302733.1 haloalkane dehalogenase [Rhodobium orientis]MBK5948514.1 haloalkane dehalogenase [Rhodobium orientis]RAI29783.1 haloalkane dehalogenase [Rhodobium orientis]
MLDAKDPYPRSTATVNGLTMAYVEAGSGAPIVFLHGNPTHSYIWRNVIPYAEPLGRCIAPDLIGMGQSEKLPNSGPDRYTYDDQRTYLFGLLDALDLGDGVVLVLHDWGGALGFDWARTNPERVRGIAFMEPMIMPLTWDMMPEPAVPAFQGFRAEGVGEKMCLEDNIFVEQVIPMAVMRDLGEDEMAAYRAPYPEPGEGRRPTLTWPRQIPIEGEPADVAAVCEANCAFLAETAIPKLFVKAEPGMMASGKVLEFCRSLPNVTEVAVPGLHYVQEDSADRIGAALAEWIEGLD